MTTLWGWRGEPERPPATPGLFDCVQVAWLPAACVCVRVRAGCWALSTFLAFSRLPDHAA